jgi:hypothetical protein
MALIGEAALGSDNCERPLGVRQQFARGPHLQALPIFARSSILKLAKDPCQVYGMHSGFPGQVAHPQRFVKPLMQKFFHAAKPPRRSPIWRFESGDGSQYFEHMTFQNGVAEIARQHLRAGGLRLESRVQAKSGPEHGSGAAIESGAPGQADSQVPQVSRA